MPIDAMTYREAMSRLGAAVNVVTTADQDGWHGFTASAVCSVTDTPPTLLVCMNRASRSRASFALGSPICVNTLGATQRDISVAFSRPGGMEERFSTGSWATLATGAPVLEEALVSFDGRIAEIAEVGTHNVLFCRIEAVRFGEEAKGLVYFGRTYHPLPGV